MSRQSSSSRNRLKSSRPESPNVFPSHRTTNTPDEADYQQQLVYENGSTMRRLKEHLETTVADEADYQQQLTYENGSTMHRLKKHLEATIAKFDRPFRRESDVIDMRTFEIVEDKSHIRSMMPRTLGSHCSKLGPKSTAHCIEGADEEPPQNEREDLDESSDSQEEDESESDDYGEEEVDEEEENEEINEERKKQMMKNQAQLKASTRIVSMELLRMINKNDQEKKTFKKSVEEIETSKINLVSNYAGNARSRPTSATSARATAYDQKSNHQSPSPRRVKNDSMDRLTQLLRQKQMLSSPGKGRNNVV